ncbi:MAG TPA: GNAT family N-acetyltransferase [Gemmatimonadales bacterium]|nr:GNAT family N-acetyltransferase [Gemmatimonadales bacterium]
MPFPESFATARLVAERLREEHYGDLLRMHSDPAQMAMLGGVRDEAQTAEYLAKNLAHWAAHGFGAWMLRDGVSRGIVGRAILRHLDVDGVDEVEVGYSLDPACWGRGLATEIAAACLEHARDDLELATVVAVTLPDNAPSRRVLEKAGLAYERDWMHGGRLHVLYRIRFPSTHG